VGAHVITTVDVTLDPDIEDALLTGYRRMIDGERPDGLLRSELLRGMAGAWRIQTTWRDLDALMAVRSSGRPPAALELLESLGAEPSHAWFTVADSLEVRG
jgi:hypothetical protein